MCSSVQIPYSKPIVKKESSTIYHNCYKKCKQSNKIKFYDISNIISEALSSHDSINNPDLNQILEADKWARRYVNNKISKLI